MLTILPLPTFAPSSNSFSRSINIKLDSMVFIKQEDPDSSNEDEGDSRGCTIPLSHQAMSWTGSDMQGLEDIFNTMRDRFQCVIYEQEDSDETCWGQDAYFQSNAEKCDLLDTCCYFLEHENLPRIHLARANLMMVWLIETETESARYADKADEIIRDLDSAVVEMFGVSDARVEDLKKDLVAAQEEVLRRTLEAGSDMDVEEESDEDDGED